MPIGTVILFSGATIPQNYLVCDGSAISRQTYSDLFETIGTVYGDGDGVDTFNIPNLLNSVPLGSSSTYLLGRSGGSEDVSLTTDSMPSHLHVIPQHGHGNDLAIKTPSLAHSITTQPGFKYNRANTSSKIYSSRDTTLKTGRGGATNMTRTTSVAISDHPATDCTMSGGVTDCPAMTSGYAGNGDAHNNMMPYIALVFLIQAEPDTPPGPIIPSMVLFNGALPVGPSGAYIAGRK